MPPPPPKIPVIALSDVIDIVDDEIIIEDDLFLEEEDFSLAVEIREYVETFEEEFEEEPIPFALVEEKPKFNGKDANEFSRWVNQRLVYPEIAKENGVQGRITMMFTVKDDGSVADVKVVRGVDPALDREAIRVISSSPKWSPGKQRDRAVPVTYTFPVIFRLR
jgi:protein TonB